MKILKIGSGEYRFLQSWKWKGSDPNITRWLNEETERIGTPGPSEGDPRAAVFLRIAESFGGKVVADDENNGETGREQRIY